MARSLLPREHGAYVQLLAPMVLAIAATRGSPAAWLVVLAACAAFVANEPLLVLLGHRGKRAHDQDQVRARWMLAVFATLAAAAGIAGLVLAPPAARAMAGLVAIPTLLLVVLGWLRKQRTLVGEAIAVIALTGASVPVETAAGMPWRAAVLLWVGWACGYGCTILAVHRVISRGKQPRSGIDVAAGITFLVAGAALAVLASRDFPLVVGAPLSLGAGIVAVLAPPPAKLRPIGFAMVGASLLSIALLLVG
ncbi:MAG TPA: YwiC-like family protein [Kofleriaceae bacterium]|nr:YwiC-like family protein [Kofleriaceae bacterium]